MDVKKIDKQDLKEDFINHHCSECYSIKGLTKITVANNIIVLCDTCRRRLIKLLETDGNTSTLKQLRLKKGLTQQQLAEKLNMSVQNLRGYENGSYVAMNTDIEQKIKNILDSNYKYTREG